MSKGNDKSEGAQTGPDEAAENLSRRAFLHQAAAAGGVAVAGVVVGIAGPQGAVAAAPTGATSATVPVSLQVNGRRHELRLEPRVTLVDALREYLGLTGTKKGCDHGQCGACTVLVDGRRIHSCLTLAVMHVGAHVTTIEGLAEGDKLHPVLHAFIEHDAFQCGYCTPGQICSASGLLHAGHAHPDADVRELMSGNICRCGAYPNIVAAVRDARTALRTST
jgi:xanthine dehydrogenase YagT iron-sulfur-binding subunit